MKTDYWKNLAMVFAAVGAVASLVSARLEEKNRDRLIEEKVEEALAKERES